MTYNIDIESEQENNVSVEPRLDEVEEIN